MAVQNSVDYQAQFVSFKINPVIAQTKTMQCPSLLHELAKFVQFRADNLLGQTATEERRRAIAEVAAETVPDMEVRNELTVIDIGGPGQAEDISD